VAYGIVLCYALLLGSTLVGSEIASGAIADLFSRPVNPWKLWFSKVLFGLLTTGALLVFAGLVGVAAVSTVVAPRPLALLVSAQRDLPLALILVLPAAVFFISLFCSAMTEQPFLAMAVSLFIMAVWAAMCWLLWAWVLTMAGAVMDSFEVGLTLLVGIIFCLVMFVPSSGLVFAKGQIHTGLRGLKWRVAGICFTATVLIGISVPAIYFNDIIHLKPGEDYEITELLLSPDRTKVAIEARSQRVGFLGSSGSIETLWIMDLTSDQRLFTGTYLNRPALTGAWSLDSRRFATWTYRKSLRKIYNTGHYYANEPSTVVLELLELDGQTVRTIRRLNLDEEQPWSPLTWSSSSDRLYCIVNATRRQPWCRIEHLSLAGTVTESIPVEGLRLPRPHLVGDGPLAFAVAQGTSTAPADARTPFDLINLSTGATTKKIDLMVSERPASFPDISSDARYVIYAKYDSPLEPGDRAEGETPPARLFLRNVSDDSETPLVENKTWQIHGLDFWSPKGLFSCDGSRYIVCDWRESEHGPRPGDIYVVNIPKNSVTHIAHILHPGGLWTLLPSWSPNDTHIAFVSACPLAPGESKNVRQSELIVVSPGEPQVTKKNLAKGAITAFVWLSDDELLYGDRNALYRVKIDGTGLKKVFPT